MASTVEGDALLTTGEAAALLGSSRQHVVDLCERGHLSYVRVGTHRRLRRAEIEALVQPRLTRDQARTNIDTLHRAHPGNAAQRWIKQWQMLLDGPLDSLLDILTSPSSGAIELRQNSPFAGVLSEHERQTALAAFRAHWRRDHVA